MSRVSQKKSPQKFTVSSQGPILKFERSVEGAFDIICDGINPSVGTFNFSLNDLPNYTEFTNLFDQYRIDKVEIEWLPEYTVLSDGGVTSPAVNVQVNTAVDPCGFSVTTVNDVLQFKTLLTSGISEKHRRVFTPKYLVDGIIPVSMLMSSSSPSINHYGLQYGISATGTAMTLRSRAKYYISCLLSR